MIHAGFSIGLSCVQLFGRVSWNAVLGPCRCIKNAEGPDDHRTLTIGLSLSYYYYVCCMFKCFCLHCY